jgi:hypothetical protein
MRRARQAAVDGVVPRSIPSGQPGHASAPRRTATAAGRAKRRSSPACGSAIRHGSGDGERRERGAEAWLAGGSVPHLWPPPTGREPRHAATPPGLVANDGERKMLSARSSGAPSSSSSCTSRIVSRTKRVVSCWLQARARRPFALASRRGVRSSSGAARAGLPDVSSAYFVPSASVIATRRHRLPSSGSSVFLRPQRDGSEEACVEQPSRPSPQAFRASNARRTQSLASSRRQHRRDRCGRSRRRRLPQDDDTLAHPVHPSSSSRRSTRERFLGRFRVVRRCVFIASGQASTPIVGGSTLAPVSPRASARSSAVAPSGAKPAHLDSVKPPGRCAAACSRRVSHTSSPGNRCRGTPSALGRDDVRRITSHVVRRSPAQVEEAAATTSTLAGR